MVRTIAVGTDGSPTADSAVQAAIDLASRHQARLVVISSYRPVSEARLRDESRDAPDDIQWSINRHEDVDAMLADVAGRARDAGLEVTALASPGDPADVLCRTAADQGADVLVIGNRGMERRILGSVPNSVAHKAPCSVFIVKTT